ncbi:DUF3786 domain-containing protein [Dethiobacter alkaliphilus]|uniref:DUF3786 domain-containing protein n=1 Tax=Dethiobacter alkaliphilus TaxID=427926 RepID=UPI002226A6D2|nr:DUF3786 domain-containing protein [Dethiobacter alkaliphilus]MCW3491407.1 DUF3786 domain-containing protein [Dethiobacter alkaliphilus]
MQYKQAYLDALRDFAAKDPAVMADLAGGRCIEDGRAIVIDYLGQHCTVTHPEGEVTVRDWPPLPHEELIIILQYLAGASGLPCREQWLSFLELPGGPHHFAPFQQEAIFPLAKALGDDSEKFLQAAETFGATKTDLGHAGAIIPAFPRLPLAFMIWLGDDEFPAKANILFDASSPTYLPTASLYMLGIAVSKRLLAAAGC